MKILSDSDLVQVNIFMFARIFWITEDHLKTLQGDTEIIFNASRRQIILACLLQATGKLKTYLSVVIDVDVFGESTLPVIRISCTG